MEQKEINFIKETLSQWGNFEIQENCLYLYNNSYLSDKILLAFLKFHKIKIQLDLFT